MKVLKIIGLISGMVLLINFSNAQQTREQYISKYQKIAIEEMRVNKIPASIKMAQALLESNNGNSDLATMARNHFGIKCNHGWSGKTFHMDDDAKDECFRRYEEIEDSYRDHSQFLKRDRYAELFTYEITDYKSWAHGLKRAGYATNPKYAELLIQIIEDNKLYMLDDPAYQESLKLPVIAEVIDEEDSSMDAFFSEQRKKQSKKRNLDPDAFVIEGKGHEIYYNNRAKYIITREGDSFESLNKEFDLIPYQLPKYNELPKDAELKADQIIYLQPKRNQAEKGKNKHTVLAGDNLYDISQLYGIKLSKLLKMNGLLPDSPIKEGDVIRLRNK